MRYSPRDYQKTAEGHIMTHPFCGLFLDMGLGKTVSTLSAVERLLNDDVTVRRVLVIAPKFVAQSVWGAEISKWEHLRHLRLAKVLGTEVQRRKALSQNADIWVINRENVPWLVRLYGRKWPFDMVVVDESSSFKNHQSQRFKALRAVKPFIDRVVLLSGTPRPNTLMELWSQVYLLDGGERLGKGIGDYRNRYFKPGVCNGAIVYTYVATKDAEKEVYEKISDICISMKAEDLLDLPEEIVVEVPITLDTEVMRGYEEFERDQVLSIGTGEITAVNAAGVSNKLLQYTGGAVYDGDRVVHRVHDQKLEALKELIEAAGEPVIVAYWFKHERDRIKEVLQVRELEGQSDIDDWNKGLIPVLLLHPAASGHGLNLQFGGSVMIWYSQIWSLELYQQTCKRLHRQGQKASAVRYFKLICEGTIDLDVVGAQRRKAKGQDGMMEAIKAKIEKYAAKTEISI